jgi:hypothetical protein
VARDADGEAEAPNQAAANEQAERFQGDALDEVIARHLSGIPDEYKAIHGVSVGDVILGALQIPPEKFFRCTNLCTNPAPTSNVGAATPSAAIPGLARPAPAARRPMRS